MQTIDDAFSALFWVAITVPLIALWIAGFWDLAHRDDLSVFRKAVWVVILIVTFYIGLAVYFATRPLRPPAGKGTSRTVPRASRIVAELEELAAKQEAGQLTDDAYLSRKRELLSL